VEGGQNLLSQDVVGEVDARGERSQTKTGRIEGHAGNGQGRFAGFVEDHLQRVAVQQVNAVEGRILRRGRELRDDLVVLGDQSCSRSLRRGVGYRSGDCAAGTATGGVGADIDGVERDGSCRRGGAGDHLAGAVVGRRKGQTVRPADQGRKIDSGVRQRLVQL